jgi:hypothetical protein
MYACPQNFTVRVFGSSSEAASWATVACIGAAATGAAMTKAATMTITTAARGSICVLASFIFFFTGKTRSRKAI